MSPDPVTHVPPAGAAPVAPGGGVPERAVLEAVLMVIDEPVSAAEVAEGLGGTAEEVEAALEELAAAFTAEGRGFDLRRVAGAWRIYSRPEHAEAVERFLVGGRQARLTQAALETLAVVAYRQPVTRSRVAAVRGVNVDGVMRTLTTRGLVAEVGTEPSGAVLYGTTHLFLERIGLRDLGELPDLAPHLPEAGELDEIAAAMTAPVRPESAPQAPPEHPAAGE